MSIATRWVRMLMVVSAAGLTGAAYAIRAVGDGLVDQFSGAALSAAIVYTIVLFVRPRISPLPAGTIAVAYCWFIEFTHLTPLPSEISQRSWFARQLLGAQFDLVDVAWYPVGVIPMVVAHWLLRTSAPTRPNSSPLSHNRALHQRRAAAEPAALREPGRFRRTSSGTPPRAEDRRVR
ncbi:DUF2809 domain-containing protein [Actinomadura coerulea]|uniref:DUF2809 domain-containing protein n=1 Tax=Actinomadura coerulea TaxID=46159 RepID=UPI003439C55E